VTNPSAAFYGVGGARISSQDGATARLDATGAVFCHTGVTEQGQGAESVIAQCVASAVGVPIERVEVAIDGCGAATFAVPLASAARAFSVWPLFMSSVPRR